MNIDKEKEIFVFYDGDLMNTWKVDETGYDFQNFGRDAMSFFQEQKKDFPYVNILEVEFPLLGGHHLRITFHSCDDENS